VLLRRLQKLSRTSMKNVAAVMLASLGGKEVSVENCTAILASVGCEVDAEKLGGLISSLEGKDLMDVLAAGQAKMASMPAGGWRRGACGGGQGAGARARGGGGGHGLRPVRLSLPSPRTCCWAAAAAAARGLASRDAISQGGFAVRTRGGSRSCASFRP